MRGTLFGGSPEWGSEGIPEPDFLAALGQDGH